MITVKFIGASGSKLRWHLERRARYAAVSPGKTQRKRAPISLQTEHTLALHVGRLSVKRHRSPGSVVCRIKKAQGVRWVIVGDGDDRETLENGSARVSGHLCGKKYAMNWPRFMLRQIFCVPLHHRHLVWSWSKPCLPVFRWSPSIMAPCRI